jgi:hypothetical protein
MFQPSTKSFKPVTNKPKIVKKYECSDLYNCCNCGGENCGCGGCFSCNACPTCIDNQDLPDGEELPCELLNCEW